MPRRVARLGVQIADAVKVTGFAPLACKIDVWVLAELSRCDLVPAIWLPTPGIRAKRERARWRLHLMRHHTALKNRFHATLLAFGHPCPDCLRPGTATGFRASGTSPAVITT